MYVTLIISLLIFSHILTDFYLQTNHIVEKKSKNNLWLLWHSSHFFICAILLTIVFINFNLLLIIAIITVTHFIIDKVKISLDKDENHSKSFLLFMIDQLVHILVIMSAYPFIQDMEPNVYLNTFLMKIISSYPFLDMINHIDLLTFIILVLSGFLFAVKGGTILSLLIINLPWEKKEWQYREHNSYIYSGIHETAAATADNESLYMSKKENMKRYGKVIGNIERILIISAILINQYSLIAILIAIKSIGRFKELNMKTSDYYIIGNLASLSIAFFIGIILVFLKKLLLS